MRVPKVSLIVLLSLLSFASALGAPRPAPAADVTCSTGPCRTYLPAVTYSITPELLSPVNGFFTQTLAPTLSWMPLALGKHVIQVSVDPAFAVADEMAVDTTKTVRAPIPAQIDTLVSSNLKGQTLYYWRVGAPVTGGYIYSSVRSFITPPKNNALLPITTNILAPKNNARIKGSTVALQWQPVAGAITYRIRMYDATGHSVSSDELGGEAYSLMVEDVPLGTYSWKVKAMNAHGWGDYSPEFVFTLY
jgi:hypothetical protein